MPAPIASLAVAPDLRATLPIASGSEFPRQLDRAIGQIAAPPPPEGNLVTRFAERALASSRQLGQMIEQAASGATFSPQELIALQARVFRCSQTIEIFAKTVEQAGNAAKQTLGTQV